MTSENSILGKNLEAIEKYNPTLKHKLLNFQNVTGDIEFCKTDLDEVNLKYKNILLHSQSGAKVEARDLFEKSEDNLLLMHFILGIGFGYLFKEFCDRAKGKVILFESNIEILKTTLEKIDLSKELSQPNVYIASDYEELYLGFSRLYEYKTDISFSILNSYRNIYWVYAQEILDQIRTINGIFCTDYNGLRDKCFSHIAAIMDNFMSIFDTKPLYEFKNIYEGKTALIVSAGPTLDFNIETIKTNRDKFVIFCVGTAAKALIKNGIIPDFLNIVENADCSGQLNGLDLSSVNMILDISAHSSFYKIKSNDKYIFPQSTSPWSYYWSYLTELDISPYSTKGTVSYQALSSAKMLGFKKLILVGQDLAFVNNSCYSKSSSYSNLIFEVNPETGKPQFIVDDYDGYLKSIAPEGMDYKDPECLKMAEKKIKYLNETINFVKGISGEMLPTEAGYSLFIEYFKDFASQNKDMELINTSLIGAQIDGFINISLQESLENVNPFEKVTLEGSFKFNKEKILDKLKLDLKILNNILIELKKGLSFVFAYESEFNTNKTTIETKTMYAGIFSIYEKLAIEYSGKSYLYNLVAYAEHVEIQYLHKKYAYMPPEEKIIHMYPAVKEYLKNVHNKVELIIEKIENNISKLDKN